MGNVIDICVLLEMRRAEAAKMKKALSSVELTKQTSQICKSKKHHQSIDELLLGLNDINGQDAEIDKLLLPLDELLVELDNLDNLDLDNLRIKI